jgi:hypothetical protein
MNNLEKQWNKVKERNKEYEMIIEYFLEKGGCKNIKFSNSFSTVVRIVDFDKTKLRPEQICKLVDEVIKKCPKRKFFSLERNYNCVNIIHKNKYSLCI